MTCCVAGNTSVTKADASGSSFETSHTRCFAGSPASRDATDSIYWTHPHFRKDSNSPAGVTIPDRYRYWIDPNRGYLCMRWEMASDAAAADSGPGTYLLEEVSRSPQGHWYPTTVRVKSAIRHEDGTTEDQLFRFYLDFAAEMPDRLFEPAR